MKTATKQKIAGGIATAITAGALLFGGGAENKDEIRATRLDLLQQAEFTREHPELCKGKNAEERCLTIQEFKLLVREYDASKNVKNEKDKVKKPILDKLNDKLLK